MAFALSNLRGGLRSAASQLQQIRTMAAGATKPVLEKEFLVYRWSPEKPDEPTYKSYKVDINQCVASVCGRFSASSVRFRVRRVRARERVSDPSSPLPRPSGAAR